MNKREFLNELERNLRGLPKDDIEGRLSFYSEMIDDIVASGKTEEEAVLELGGIDNVLADIACDTPLKSLVKEKMRPRKKASGLLILILILGFPLWFPLLITAFVLCLVGCLLTWIFVIVAYSIEISFIVSSITCLAAFFMYWASSDKLLILVGLALLLAGISILFLYVCKYITIFNAKLNKKILLGIKRGLIKGGNRNE